MLAQPDWIVRGMRPDVKFKSLLSGGEPFHRVTSNFLLTNSAISSVNLSIQDLHAHGLYAPVNYDSNFR